MDAISPILLHFIITAFCDSFLLLLFYIDIDFLKLRDDLPYFALFNIKQTKTFDPVVLGVTTRFFLDINHKLDQKLEKKIHVYLFDTYTRPLIHVSIAFF